MKPDDSLSHWILGLKDGDPEAVQKVWEGYYEKLVRLARKKLLGAKKRVVDEEDVALSAFNSFFHAASSGRFPRLNDRDDLWKLLVVITSRKAMMHLRHEGRAKRGGGAVRGESVFLKSDSEGRGLGLESFLGDEPSPEMAALMVESCQELLAQLGDETLRSIAVWKMEGYTNKEIAEKLGVLPRTVERKLERIRARWEKDSEE